jgi:hypothetical protein
MRACSTPSSASSFATASDIPARKQQQQQQQQQPPPPPRANRRAADDDEDDAAAVAAGFVRGAARSFFCARWGAGVLRSRGVPCPAGGWVGAWVGAGSAAANR